MERELAGRRIVLGVGGGVAAYKAVEVCRELVRRGAFVSPVLTESAQRFVGPATFSAVASESARTSLWQSPEPSPHTLLGQRADLIVLAPATANLLASMRAGLAGDLLTTTLLASRAPVLACPAMHEEMWEHPATSDNVSALRARGVEFVPPARGELAGGDVGVGRLAEPAVIVAACTRLLGAARGDAVRDTHPRMDGVSLLVSAGGTREPLDPVRFLGNRSSGRQGQEIALAALDRGATVTLVTTAEPPAGIDPRATVLRVETAEEMRSAMLGSVGESDIVVMCAAVADFRPVAPALVKLKRGAGVPEVLLEPTPDILRELVQGRRADQVIVGFAAETHDVDENARHKLVDKGVDLLVANDVSLPGVGFEHATNAVQIHAAGDAEPRIVELASKRVVADAVLDAALERLAARAVAPT